MIKICFYAYHAHHLFKEGERSYGGAEINFYYLSREFAKKSNYQVTFLVGDDGQSAIEVIDGIKLKKIKNYHDRKKTFWHRFTKRLSIIKEFITNDADIFVFSTAWAGNIMFYCLLFAKWMKGKKIIYRVASDRDVDGYYRKEKSILSKQYLFSLKRADQIITQNQHQKDLLFNTEKLESLVIKNGFPLERKRLILKRKYYLWVGRAINIKKPKVFLEIASQLPEHQFLLIIPGTGDIKQEVLSISKYMSNVKVVDQVNFFEIDRYFAEAKCFINTSDFEGFPNTFIQSFMNYTPICSINVNPDNIISKYQLGEFCNGSVQRAIDFLRELKEEKWTELGYNGFQYIKKNHNLIDKVKQYENLFLQLR